jgi:D-glycero-alpha-D-manno-heptose-7-phosphate kinase
VSFFGGGTDYPAYYMKNGGQTLGVSMDKYTYITVKRLPEFADHKIRASYSVIEQCQTIDKVDHPSIRECLRHMDLHGPIEISVVADLPSRTGVGSSSSFTVGLLNALHASKGSSLEVGELATEAVYVEQELIKEQVGVQDQFTTAYGGLLHLKFSKDGTISANPVQINPARQSALSEKLVLFYTGIRRVASKTLDEQLERTEAGEIDAQLGEMGKLVDQGLGVLEGTGPLTDFGELLHEGWTIKRQLSSKVSSELIDGMYESALGAGATGGKLMGAGSGGFLMMYVEPDKKSDVINALSSLPVVDFNFESSGSQVILRSTESPEFA